MENNFELEEMKQQWATLQTALNSQKEINIKLILNGAKRRLAWNKTFLRISSFTSLLITVPYCLFILPRIGVTQPIYIVLTLLLIIGSLNSLYMLHIVQTPNDSNIDVLEYRKSLIKFKKHYLGSVAFGILSLITMIIWMIINMGLDMTNPMAIGGVIGGAIGAIIGISLNFKVLSNIKELQSDIDLIKDIKE